MEANILAYLSTLGQIPHGCPERQAFLCPCLTDEETQQSQMPRLRCGRRQRMRWVAPALLAARSLCPPTTTCYPSHPSHRQSLERGRRHFRYGAREAPVEGYKTQEHSVLKKKIHLPSGKSLAAPSSASALGQPGPPVTGLSSARVFLACLLWCEGPHAGSLCH